MQDAQNKSGSSAPSGNANADGVVGEIEAQALLAASFAESEGDGAGTAAAQGNLDGENGGGNDGGAQVEVDGQAGENGGGDPDKGASQDGAGENGGDASGENGGQGSREGENPDGEAAGNPFERSARGWQKRVDKLTAQKKAKDDEIERLKSEIEALKSGRSAQKKNTQQENPVDGIGTVEELDKFAAETRAERDKVLALLSSADPDFEIGGQVYTREQVAGYLKILNADLDERIPARRGQLSFGSTLAEKSKENDALIAKVFPDFKAGSAEDEWIKEQLSDRFFEANKKVLLHYAWRGLAASKIEAKYRDKHGNKGAVRAIPPAAPTSSAQPARVADAFNEDGSVRLDFASKIFD